MIPLDVGIASGSLSSGAELLPYLDRLQAAGARSVRAQANWLRLEPTLGGAVDLSSYARIVDGCKARNMKLVAGLGNREDQQQYEPDHRAGYARTVAMIADEFGDDLDSIELGNEIDHERTDRKPWPDRYAAFHIEAFTAIKAVAPDLLVGNGGIGGQKADWWLPERPPPGKPATAAEWWAEVYKYGIAGHIDINMTHMYPGEGTIRDSIVDERRDGYLTRSMHRTCIRNGDNIPTRLTEIGWHTGGDRNPLTPVEQAARLRNASRFCAAHEWIVGMNWFTWQDVGLDPTNTGDWTGLVYKDGSPKPALAAFTEAADRYAA